MTRIPKLSLAFALLLPIAYAPADTVKVPTADPAFTFFLSECQGGTPPKPAYIGAANTLTKAYIWKASLGMSTTVKIAGSMDGKFFALLIGDNREGSQFKAGTDKGNTLFLLNGKTGELLATKEPLKGFAAAPWANPIWQDLQIEFNDDTLTVSGNIFSYPDHPEPVAFEKSYSMPKAEPETSGK